MQTNTLRIWVFLIITGLVPQSFNCGMDRVAEADVPSFFEIVTFRDQSFEVVHIDPAKEQLGLFWKDQNGEAFNNFTQLASNLEAQGKDLFFATNAGIFSKDFSPGGLHVENGKELSPLNLNDGPGNFHMKPNGVFYLDGKKAGVQESVGYAKSGRSPGIATQSGPMLVIENELHHAFNEGSQNKYIRNGVGVSRDGMVHIAISRRPVNFYDFASLFKDRLGCANALYLDGSISRIYHPAEGVTDGNGQFVGMLGVTRNLENQGAEAGGVFK